MEYLKFCKAERRLEVWLMVETPLFCSSLFGKIFGELLAAVIN